MSSRPTQPVRRPRSEPAQRAAPPAAARSAANQSAKRSAERAAEQSAEQPAERVGGTPEPAAAKPSTRQPAGRSSAPSSATSRAGATTRSRTSPPRTSPPRPRTSVSGAGRPVAPRPRAGAASDTTEVPTPLPVVIAPTSRSRALQALYLARVSNGSVGRFAARARRRRWTTWRPFAVVLGLITVIGLGGWVVGFSPLLSAREVQLVGADRVTQAEVDALVAPEIGRPLSRLDAEAVRSRVEALPEVESVQVLRVWPSTVEVRVTERVPVAAVPDPGGFSLVDAAGVQVELVAEAPAGLPVVSGETVNAGDDALLAAARVLEALPPALSEQVTGTTAGTPDSVTLTLASGATVVWGSPDESDRKAAVLQVLLATPAEVYDVSAPGTPVTR